MDWVQRKDGAPRVGRPSYEPRDRCSENRKTLLTLVGSILSQLSTMADDAAAQRRRIVVLISGSGLYPHRYNSHHEHPPCRRDEPTGPHRCAEHPCTTWHADRSRPLQPQGRLRPHARTERRPAHPNAPPRAAAVPQGGARAHPHDVRRRDRAHRT